MRDYRAIFFIVYLPIVLLSKVLRWTLLKKTTVDTGIGHRMLEFILNLDLKNTDSVFYNGANANAIDFYRLVNIFDLNTYIEFEIYITVMFNTLLLSILFLTFKNKKMDLFQTFFLMFSVGVMNIYTFCLSKEPVQMLYFIALYFILLRKRPISKKWIACSILITIMALMTRSYFFLMLAFSFETKIFFDYILKRFNNRQSFILLLLAVGLTYFFFLQLSSIVRPGDFHELIRVRTRLNDSTTTQIVAIFSSQNLLVFSLNYIITILRMMIPAELILYGPKYLTFIVYQLMVTMVMLKGLFKNKSDKNDNGLISTYLYWGFVFCAATFEPDFGSWIRHESVVIPVMLFTLTNHSSKKSYAQ